MDISPSGVTEARLSIQAASSGSIPTDGLFRKADWEVRPCSLILAQALVAKHHYTHGGSNTAVYVHGLFPRGAVWERDCKGVAWWLPPTRDAAAANYPVNPDGVLALSRLVVLDGVPKNACSFLVRHSMRHFIDRARWPFLLTYADEWQGHLGTIYKAAGFIEAGFTKPSRVYVKDGRVMSRKATRTRTHTEMLALGCVHIGKFRKRRFIHIEERSHE